MPSAHNANEIQRFKFDTPSPDDSVLEAQKRATGSAESSSSQHAHSVPSSARSATAQPQNLADSHAITEGKSAIQDTLHQAVGNMSRYTLQWQLINVSFMTSQQEGQSRQVS